MDFNFSFVVSFAALSHLMDSYFKHLVLEFNVVQLQHLQVVPLIDYQHFLIGLLSFAYWPFLINFR